MTRILLGLSGGPDAGVAAKVAGLLRARGHQLHIAWFGTRAQFERARSAGLPDCEATIAEAPIAEAPPGDARIAASAFAADHRLHRFDSELVLIAQGDDFALALALSAADRGVPCVQLAAGGRDGERRQRLADHAASHCCVPDALRRLRLLREGLRDEAIAVAESPEAIAAALTAWTAPASTPPNDLPTDADASGRTLGDEELLLLEDVVRGGTLNSTRGTYVHRFERAFARWLGVRHAVACASGSAAVHCAIAALELAAGDEVITTPITDMGALTPILYEGAVPVFADVDPATLNVTADTIAAQCTARTRAIVVTHLFGRPAELDDILAFAADRGLPVVEDAAQAFGATWRGRKVGTFGRIAAFSLQQGKHITTGEGGIVCTDDDELARRLFLFVNKAWGYGDRQPDHYFPALNYRMTELQGAVACAQLPKLDDVVHARRTAAGWLCAELAGLGGIALPSDPAAGSHSYWKFALAVDADRVPGGAIALGERMRSRGVACAPRYVQKPAFECELFRAWQRSPVTGRPYAARGAERTLLFDRVDYPGAVHGLDQVVVVPVNERYTHSHCKTVAAAIRAAHRELTT